VNLEGFSDELRTSLRDLDKLLRDGQIPAAVRERAADVVDGGMRESIDFIRTAVSRLSRIIDALLRLSRAGRVTYQRQVLDVDLIVRRSGVVAFVEVKTRRGNACGSPLEAVPKRKQSIIGRVAALWALRFGRKDDTFRFDLLAVHLHPAGRVEIEHLEDAWRL